MKELNSMEVEQVVGAGTGYITNIVGGALGQVNILLDSTLGNVVGQTVQNTEINLGDFLGSLISFTS